MKDSESTVDGPIGDKETLPAWQPKVVLCFRPSRRHARLHQNMGLCTVLT